jgi:hypothetical protein
VGTVPFANSRVEPGQAVVLHEDRVRDQLSAAEELGFLGHREAALLAAGAALAHSRGAEARMAYEAVVTSTQAPLAPVARASGSAGREETLYYLISH